MNAGAASCCNALQVAASSLALVVRPRDSWKAAIARPMLLLKMPSISPGENQARSSRIWARNTADPLAPAARDGVDPSELSWLMCCVASTGTFGAVCFEDVGCLRCSAACALGAPSEPASMLATINSATTTGRRRDTKGRCRMERSIEVKLDLKPLPRPCCRLGPTSSVSGSRNRDDCQLRHQASAISATASAQSAGATRPVRSRLA